MSMDEKNSVPFIVHEADMTRMERSNHRLWVVVIVLIIVCLLTNGGWIWYESQREVIEETTTQTVTQEAQSDSGSARNTYIGGDNGESETDSHEDY